ncbi:MAG: hydroxymyristoyl-ACP dehydratase [Alistipes sp.]|nr:hydroxymyristoyl-ACP dehydratase [Alistipes sp.]
MKLLDSLYTIVSEDVAEGRHSYTIELDPEHFIYKAHFPGEPITPGVCIMQIAHELLEKLCDCQLNIECVKSVKFLRVISPNENTTINYIFQKVTIDEGGVKCQVEVATEEVTFAKLSIVCSK